MLRGFRWQLLAFVAAIVLFFVSLLTRPTDGSTPAVITATPPSSMVSEPTPITDTSPTATPQVEVITSPFPTASENIDSDTDGVPTYSEALVGNVQRLNPLLASLNPVDADITALIFEGLTTINQYGEVIPLLAEDWVISSNGLEYVFILRDDILWHDGTRFTAADVGYTTSLLSSPDFPGSPEIGEFWRTVETQIINDFLVRFRLPQPLGSFPEALRIGILPNHALQGTSALQIASHPFNLDPIGTGPYQIEGIRQVDGRIEQIDLRVAPVYRQRPEGRDNYQIDRMRFRLYQDFDSVLNALQTGEVQGYATRDDAERLPLLDINANLVPYTAQGPATGMLIFNWENETLPAFRELRVRQALASALDRDSIIQRHLLNRAVRADNPYPQLMWVYDGSLRWPAYNVQAARDIISVVDLSLEEPDAETTPEVDAPTPEPATGLFSFTILTIDEPALVNVAQEIATQWSLLDINVTVEAVDAETYQQRLSSGDFEAALTEISPEPSADPDLYAFWHEGQYPDGQNYGGVSDRRISEMLERGRQEASGTNRVIFYREFQQAFIERAIAIPLYYPLFTYVTSPQVNGIQLGIISRPSDRFMTLRNWTINP